MTMTDEHLSFPNRPRLPGASVDGSPFAPRDQWFEKHATREAEDARREAREERRHLRLIVAAGLALALAIAGGLAAAWQADRWLTDWHYGLGQSAPVEPDGLDHPSAYTPGVRA